MQRKGKVQEPLSRYRADINISSGNLFRGFIKAMEASSFGNPDDERKQRDKAAARASGKDDGWRKRLKRSGTS